MTSVFISNSLALFKWSLKEFFLRLAQAWSQVHLFTYMEENGDTRGLGGQGLVAVPEKIFANLFLNLRESHEVVKYFL
jgi:hypothetical protein